VFRLRPASEKQTKHFNIFSAKKFKSCNTRTEQN